MHEEKLIRKKHKKEKRKREVHIKQETGEENDEVWSLLFFLENVYTHFSVFNSGSLLYSLYIRCHDDVRKVFFK